ncbi:NUDIX hydrolase [Leadbetterella byssophila DSM 17132]|uniref:GDP-mannose pyrophosphatase n=1 Tax=Leadbetterella byssophila (strain DSM 17132 / JCM 16389 / KACC 11308 / NBRC 106382 / 4M15) TaxID=649349 RepID=E4RU48_LEAB4|nr:NUDIX hydrolase [Leadbetterella byssophila]ADQ16029.1 NUDIX hydrolase [Leadbetterella byssophila DSM 17132]
MSNKWKKLDSQTVYENPWIEVQHHEVINPSGGKGIYGQVNFKNLAIGIVPLDKEGNTYLVGQHRFPIDEYSWEIPEGGCPHDEDILDCAKRELLEETGLRAEKWTQISKIHTSNSVCNETGFIFLAEELTQGEAEPEETEDLVVRKVSLEEAFQMVMKDEITDSLSIAGILKTRLLRKY